MVACSGRWQVDKPRRLSCGLTRDARRSKTGGRALSGRASRAESRAHEPVCQARVRRSSWSDGTSEEVTADRHVELVKQRPGSRHSGRDLTDRAGSGAAPTSLGCVDLTAALLTRWGDHTLTPLTSELACASVHRSHERKTHQPTRDII